LTEEYRPTTFENKDVITIKRIFVLTKEQHRPRALKRKF
jgi:hypothetical protein